MLAQVGCRLAGKGLVEVGPRRDVSRIVLCSKRLRHDVGEVRSQAVDAQEERLRAGRPLADECDALIGAAPRVGLLFGRVEHPAYRLSATREVDVQHRLRLALPHRLRYDVPVEAVLLGPPLLVHMPLADVVQGVAAGPQQTGEGGDVRRQAPAPRRRDVGVDHHAVVVGIAPGEQRGARRRAHRRGGVGEIEGRPLAREPVQVGRLADRVAVAAQGILAELIGEKQDDVGSVHDPQCAQSRGLPPAGTA